MKSFKEWLSDFEKSSEYIAFPIHLKQSLDITPNIRQSIKSVKIDINNSSNVAIFSLYKPISKIL